MEVGSLRPRNDNPAVSKIIQPIVVEKATIMVGIRFGNSSKIMQENVPLPDIFAAIIKSEFAYAKEIPLTFLAKKGIFTIATATSELKILVYPITATIANASKTYGNAINTSTERIKILSKKPPK